MPKMLSDTHHSQISRSTKQLNLLLELEGTEARPRSNFPERSLLFDFDNCRDKRRARRYLTHFAFLWRPGRSFNRILCATKYTTWNVGEKVADRFSANFYSVNVDRICILLFQIMFSYFTIHKYMLFLFCYLGAFEFKKKYI
jgi:hypothetical protein